MKKFAVKYGMIKFGIPASILTIVIKVILDCQGEFELIEWTDFINIISVVIIVLYILLGYIWGLCMWKLLKYKEDKTNNQREK